MSNPNFTFGNHEHKEPEVSKELEYHHYSKIQWDEWLAQNRHLIEILNAKNAGCIISNNNFEYYINKYKNERQS